MNKQVILVTLERDEGFDPVARWDRTQYTYGHGTKAPGKGATITRQEAAAKLSIRVDQAIKEFYEIFGELSMSEVRQHALVNMIFNLGKGMYKPQADGSVKRSGFLGFHNMVMAIWHDDWDKAADEAMDSQWYRKDVPRWRSDRIVKELREG